MASQELHDLRAKSDWPGCQAHLLQCVANDPTDSESWFLLSEAHGHQGHWPDALATANRSVALDPLKYQAWVFLANAHAGAGDWRSVKACSHRALELCPGLPQAHWLKSHACMAAGDWGAAWESSEYGFLCDRRKNRGLHHKAWTGQDLKSKVILVWGEQGAGDTIQYARFIRNLKVLGANVIFEVRPSLLGMLEGIADLTVAENPDKFTAFNYDYHVSVMSIPHRLELKTTDIDGGPYLKFIEREDAIGKIGVCWRGYSGHGNDKNRSMPDSAIDALRDIDDIVAIMPGHKDLPDWITNVPISDFGSTASVIAGLKCLITVDTSTAHIAGALGVPTLMFAPLNHSEARWGDFKTTPWYDSWQIVHRSSFDEIDAEVTEFLECI
jgi:hypothetical protein